MKYRTKSDTFMCRTKQPKREAAGAHGPRVYPDNLEIKHTLESLWYFYCRHPEKCV